MRKKTKATAIKFHINNEIDRVKLKFIDFKTELLAVTRLYKIIFDCFFNLKKTFCSIR